MAAKGYLGHVSPSGETAQGLLDATGYPYLSMGENIARNNYPDSQAAQVAMSGFLASPAHSRNILEPSFTRIGIAVVAGADGMKYFCVVFAGR